MFASLVCIITSRVDLIKNSNAADAVALKLANSQVVDAQNTSRVRGTWKGATADCMSRP